MDELKKSVMDTTVTLIESVSIVSLTSDGATEKVVCIEVIRSCINRLAVLTNNDFEHRNIMYYYSIPISLLEMSILALRNIAETMNFKNVEECIKDAEEILFMLDRWEKSKEASHE